MSHCRYTSNVHGSHWRVSDAKSKAVSPADSTAGKAMSKDSRNSGAANCRAQPSWVTAAATTSERMKHTREKKRKENGVQKVSRQPRAVGIKKK